MPVNIKELIEAAGAGKKARLYFTFANAMLIGGLVMLVLSYFFREYYIYVAWSVLTSIALQFLGIMWLSIMALRKYWRNR